MITHAIKSVKHSDLCHKCRPWLLCPCYFVAAWAGRNIHC